MARSTVLESSSMRPSLRKRSRAVRREVAERIASASLDLPDRRGSSLSQRSKSAATMAADLSWRTFTRVAGSWPRMSASTSHSPP